MSGENSTPDSDSELQSYKGLDIRESHDSLVMYFEERFTNEGFAMFEGNRFYDFVMLDVGYRDGKDEILPKLSISKAGITSIVLNLEGVRQFVGKANTFSEKQTMIETYMGLGIAEAFLVYNAEFNTGSNSKFLQDRTNLHYLFTEPEVQDHFSMGEFAIQFLDDETVEDLLRLRACFGLLYRADSLLEDIARPKFEMALEDDRINKVVHKEFIRSHIPGAEGSAVAAKWDVTTFPMIEIAGSYPMEDEELRVLLGFDVE